MKEEIASYGISLSFQIDDLRYGDLHFTVRYQSAFFSGEVSINDFMTSTPDSLFREMASEWRGWAGEKTWEDHEGWLRLRATHDAKAFATVVVSMRRFDFAHQTVQSRLIAEIVLDCGSLDCEARRLEHLFSGAKVQSG